MEGEVDNSNISPSGALGWKPRAVAAVFRQNMAEKTLALSFHLCLIFVYLSQPLGFHFEKILANMF